MEQFKQATTCLKILTNCEQGLQGTRAKSPASTKTDSGSQMEDHANIRAENHTDPRGIAQAHNGKLTVSRAHMHGHKSTRAYRNTGTRSSN